MFVIDINALLAVNFLYFGSDVGTYTVTAELIIINASYTKHIMRIQSTGCQLLTLVNMITVMYQNTSGVRNRIDAGLALFRSVDRNVVHNAFSCFIDRNRTGNLREDSHLLRSACFKQFFNTGKTLCDIVTGNTACVESTHGQLCARFTDGLCGNNADCFPGIGRKSGSQIDAVAACADAGSRFTGQNRADKYFVYTVFFKNLCIFRFQHMLRIKEQLSAFRVSNGFCRETPFDGGSEIFYQLTAVINSSCPYAVFCLAVFLADNNILADIYHSTGQITGVRRTESGIRHSLSGTSRGNEIFQNGKTFTEIGLDRDFNRFTGSIRHQAAHTGELTNLIHAASGTGVCHHVNRVMLVKHIRKGIRDILCCFLPFRHDQTVAFIFCDETAFVLTLNVDNFLLRCGNQLFLCGRNRHIGNRNRYGTFCGVLVTKGFDAVKHFRGNRKSMCLNAAVDNVSQLFFANLEADLLIEHMFRISAVYITEILRNRFIVNNTSDCSVNNLMCFYSVNCLRNAQTNRSMKSYNALVVSHNGFIAVTIAVQGAIGTWLFAFPLKLQIRLIDFIAADYSAGFKSGIARIFHDQLFCSFFVLSDADHRQIIGTEDHILSRNRNRMTVLRPEEVIGR